VRRVQIRKVAQLGTGHTPSRSVEAYWEASECTIPWLTLADVWQLRDGSVSVIHDTKEKVSPLGLANSAAVRHPAGTVALSRTASVGFSCILGIDMATSQDFVTWTCGPKLDPRYLLWALRGERNDILGRTQGSTHKTIYMPDIEQLTIPLPSLDEQRRIVDYLDRVTARIDKVVMMRGELASLLEERVAAVIARAVSGENIGIRWDGVPDKVGAYQMVRLGRVADVRSGLTLDAARRFTAPSS
jgi:type I restriction enzyme S subunit